MTTKHLRGPRRLIRHEGDGGNESSTSTNRTSVVSDESIIGRALRTLSIQKQKRPVASGISASRGPLGLHLLHSPAEPLIDIIFVHGLRGGSFKRWTRSGDPDLFWPQAWLGRDPELQGARIHSFGYSSDWAETGGGNLDINDFGRSLFGHLQTSPVLRKGRPNPIILIGHSMGGLVIKKAYLLAQQDENAKSLAGRLKCMFFIATPHRGSDAAKLLDRVLRASTLGSKSYVTDLQRNSGMITNINDSFRHHVNKLHLWSFYETEVTIKAGLSMEIVDKDSAVIGAPHEHISPLYADHLRVCKFNSVSDPNYITIRNSLVMATEEILGGALEDKKEESLRELSDLEGYLSIQNYPDDDLNILESKKTAGSCVWVTELASVRDWIDSSNPVIQMHWLSGQAGVGKSVLTGHLIRHLETLELDTCYYFFREGRKTQQTVSGFLRSLAYQMAAIHSSVRTRLGLLQKSGTTFDAEDELQIWRKLFIQCIFTVSISRTQFWVLDGFDECSDAQKLFPLLTRLDANFPIRIHLSSRRLPELEKPILNFGHSLHHHIKVEDIAPDIELYIEARSDDLPVEEEDREELIKKLIDKSCGTFLWVVLACEELSQVFSEDEIDDVLDHVPSGMAPLYGKILNSMAQHVQHRDLIQKTLEWCICGTRPMSIRELQAALTLDRKSKALNMRKLVEQLCGQLLRIDSNGVIQVIHSTIRDFLLDPNSQAPFSINRSEVNRRLATVCLEYLSSEDMRPPRHPRLVSTSPTSDFASYASTSWSDHLASSPSTSDKLLTSLQKFFRTNVLAWIEYILHQNHNMYHLTRASKHVYRYLERQESHASHLHHSLNCLTKWTIDLVRLTLKFGQYLIQDPSAIYFIVPSLCPKNSAIYQQFANASYGPHIQGLVENDWDDCVSSIDWQDSVAVSLATCEERFAIGMGSGAIEIYQQSTCQISATLDHGEPVEVMEFNRSSNLIASSGFKYVKLWDVNGTLIWSIKVRSSIKTMVFSHEDTIILAVDQNTKIWDINSQDGSRTQSAGVGLTPGVGYGMQVVTSADIDPEGNLVALAYRGRPAQIWSISENAMIKECHLARDTRGVRTMAVSQLLFNPNAEIELLAVCYQDLHLAIFDKWSGDDQNEIHSLGGDALILAATADGKTLATGNTSGLIKLWDFETLTPIYSIKSDEYVVRSLAFSGDGFRVYDIRDTKTKIWEPAALVRKAISEGSTATKFIAGSAKDIGQTRDNIPITYITAPCKARCVFVGRRDGSVLEYDRATGAIISTLYAHQSRESITSVSCSNEYIASTDFIGRLEIHDLSHSSDDRWRANRIVLKRDIPHFVRAVWTHPSRPWLLLCRGRQPPIIFDITSQSEHQVNLDHSESNVIEPSPWVWAEFQDETSTIIGAQDGHIVVLSLRGDDLGQSWKVEVEFEEVPYKIEKIQCSPNGKYIAVILNSDETATSHNRHLVVYRLPQEIESTLEETLPRSPIEPLFSPLPLEVNAFLGFHNDRVVFLGNDLWVRSVDIAKMPGHATLKALIKRHFFIPREFVSGNNGVDGILTEEGSVVLPKSGELAVVSHAYWHFEDADTVSQTSQRRQISARTRGRT
ncbi:unnamed protein product [Clonostachys rosea]|uniref:GPI inositol-deacylase n=1 Tax=Bionectria ochroleuca TaxID=29856 RepID=A0ABY6UMW0_BIOOC|nr:unnamed protein product [Clonostachys rosea]